MYIHEKLSLNFIGCVTLGVIAFFIILGNREVLGNAADTVSNQIYASVASATESALCYEQSDIDAKKAEVQKQNVEFGTIPTKIAAIDNQTDKLQTVIDSYNGQISDLQTQLVPESSFTALQSQIDAVSKQIEDAASAERLSSTHADLTKQISILKNAALTANSNEDAAKKLLDTSIAELADLQKIQPQIDAYQNAKSDLDQVTTQLADQKVLDNKALEVAQDKLASGASSNSAAQSGAAQNAALQNTYNTALNSYNQLYSAYTAKYAANALASNGPITYTELAAAKDRITDVYTTAQTAYNQALISFNAKYKNSTEMSESDLSNSITHLQSVYDIAKAAVDDLNNKITGLQKEFQDNEASLVAVSSSTGAGIATLKEQLVDLNKNYETLNLSDSSAQSQISALQTKIDAMKSSMTTLASQKVDLKAQYTTLQESIKKLNDDIEYDSLSVCKG